MMDLHCHIDLYPDPEWLVQECDAAGIYVLAVTTSPKAWSGNKKLLAKTKRIRPALGLHPQVARERLSELPLFNALIGESTYIGEIGLDGSREFKNSLEQQLIAFRYILNCCANAGGRVMSIHSRGAARLVIQEIQSARNCGTPIFHWFSGTKTELEAAIEMGAWFSVGPAMLSSAKGRALTHQMPRDRILLESDGPFGKIEGKPLSPLDMNKGMQMLSAVWNDSMEGVKQRLTLSLRNLVSIAREPKLRSERDGAAL